MGAKRVKTKDSKETVPAIFKIITKMNQPKNYCVDEETEFAGEFKKLCKADKIQIYTKKSKSEAAFAERTIDP